MKDELTTEQLTRCPVCKKDFWTTGLRNHILNRAVAEVYKWYKTRKKEDKPHQNYIEKNSSFVKVRKLKI